MKKYLVPALFVSLSVSAGEYWDERTVNIHGNVIESKKAAYDEGVMMSKLYSEKSSAQLRSELPHPSFANAHSFSVEDINVRVDEYMDGNGVLIYRPVLNLSYKYSFSESGSR